MKAEDYDILIVDDEVEYTKVLKKFSALKALTSKPCQVAMKPFLNSG